MASTWGVPLRLTAGSRSKASLPAMIGYQVIATVLAITLCIKLEMGYLRGMVIGMILTLA